jgi:hypothetical protein
VQAVAGSGLQALAAAVPSAGCLQLCREEAALPHDVALCLLAIARHCAQLGASFPQSQASVSPPNSNRNAVQLVLCYDDQSVRHAALRAAAASRVGFCGAPLQSAHRKVRQVRVDCRESNRQTPCKLVRSVRDLHAAQQRKRRGVLGQQDAMAEQREREGRC